MDRTSRTFARRQAFLPVALVALAALAVVAVVVVALSLVVMAASQAPSPARTYRWTLPPGFPEPRVPADNPMSDQKVALGRHLFYDTRLSSTGTFACATCHQQARAFADDKPRGVGVTGVRHPRGAMSLTNVAYSPVLTWANPTVRRLEAQALVPMFGTDPVELGLQGHESALLARLRADARYRDLFAASFPGDGELFSIDHLTKAIAAFERTLLSGRSPYDRYRTTMDATAIPPAAHRGEDLFFSERLSCFRCHSGFNFTQTVDSVKLAAPVVTFFNNGLYNVDGRGAYPVPNTGVHAVTGDARDMGQFKPPTLRNIALTAPYMHDGSLPTLEAVIAHYESGGRGHSPLTSPIIKGFTLSAEERRDVIAFLESLTDLAFTTDPALANPWAEEVGRTTTAATSSPSRGATSPVPPAPASLASASAAPIAAAADATGGVTAPRTIDFDVVLRGLSLDPGTLDLDRAATGGRGAAGDAMPDADELALVAAVLARPTLDLRANRGLEGRAVAEAFQAARATAIDDIRILSAAYPTAADAIAGYALLGRDALTAFATAMTSLDGRVKGDYRSAFALERFLGARGDADGDGVSNVAEYRATIRRGREVWITAALDPAIH